MAIASTNFAHDLDVLAMIIVVAIVGLAGLMFVGRELSRLDDQADLQGC